jgi:hypothetical protein
MTIELLRLVGISGAAERVDNFHQFSGDAACQRRRRLCNPRC